MGVSAALPKDIGSGSSGARIERGYAPTADGKDASHLSLSKGPSPPGATGPNGRFRAIPRPSFADKSRSHARLARAPTHRPSPVAFPTRRYPALAGGGFCVSAIWFTRRHEDVVRAAGAVHYCSGRAWLQRRYRERLRRMRSIFVSSCGIIVPARRSGKSRPGAATLSLRDGTQWPMRTVPALFGGLGPKLVPQQADLFLGLVPLNRFPPRFRGRDLLRALPLGRELWVPRHGRSPERSVNAGISGTSWAGVDEAG